MGASRWVSRGASVGTCRARVQVLNRLEVASS